MPSVALSAVGKALSTRTPYFAIFEKPAGLDAARTASVTSGYLVDTDWVIHWLNGHAAIGRRLEEVRPRGLALSVISLAELYVDRPPFDVILDDRSIVSAHLDGRAWRAIIVAG